MFIYQNKAILFLKQEQISATRLRNINVSSMADVCSCFNQGYYS